MKLSFSDQKKVFNIHTDGIPFLSFDMLDRLGVPNLYSTRYEAYDDKTGTGISGLRLAVMKTDDIREAAPVVTANRDRLARQLASSIEHECITEQQHTDNVYVVTPDDTGPIRPKEKPPHRRSVDGLVTDIPDVLLTAFGGDCPPVYLADPVRKAVGLVHSGWRGTLGRISAKATALMTERFGCDPADMYAAIGPGICGDCYEMGDEVYDAFAGKWGMQKAGRIMKRYPEGKYHLDLREACLITLTEAGIPADRIAVSNVCTRCNADTFYSYRARRMENEQAAMLVNRFT
ncbi:MAG: peptidoglycan editing factor PgeF [Lachnospiraceae bacterium]|nr:peptidoglycan editing factor PgeF [Lachnospiraceae bacterium]